MSVALLPVTKIIPLSQLAASATSRAQVIQGVVSIGNFDGVHLGHALLLQAIRRLADKISGPAVVVVFDPHPAAILRPERLPPRLTWIERRAELMSKYGIDALVVCETTAEFLRLTAQEFFDSLVVGQLQAQAMVEGPNFFFGRDRGGDVNVLTDLCRQNDIVLQIASPSEVDSKMISSTRIRALINRGAVAEAAELLGTAYRIRGLVSKGLGRGRKIGFPTANLSKIDVLVPAAGVYAGFVSIGDQQHQAAIHIGPNPTFDDDRTVKVEVHLIDYDDDLYGQQLMVDFVARVRDIARFDSAADLIDQLERDIASTCKILDTTNPSHN